MKVHTIDHIVLSARDVAGLLDFYETVLGMERREEKPGKWALCFGTQKISVQDAARMPAIAGNTLPGTANLCLLTEDSVEAVISHLNRTGIEVIEGPGERIGATGRLMSVYFRDPEGNLVEVSQLLA